MLTIQAKPRRQNPGLSSRPSLECVWRNGSVQNPVGQNPVGHQGPHYFCQHTFPEQCIFPTLHPAHALRVWGLSRLTVTWCLLCYCWWRSCTYAPPVWHPYHLVLQTFSQAVGVLVDVALRDLLGLTAR